VCAATAFTNAEPSTALPIGPAHTLFFEPPGEKSRPPFAGCHVRLIVGTELSNVDGDMVCFGKFKCITELADYGFTVGFGVVPFGAQPGVGVRADPFGALMGKIERVVVMW